MSNYEFSRPFTETRYHPVWFRVDDGGDTISWDVTNHAKVVAEIEHLLLVIRGGNYTLKVTRVSDGCKIDLIKRIRSDTGLGLKDSKDIADGTTFHRDLRPAKARELQRIWRSFGCEVKIFDAAGMEQVEDEVPF